MADIKIKEIGKNTIKGIDKAINLTAKTKDAIVDIKEKNSNINSDNSTTDFGSREINSFSSSTSRGSINRLNKYGKESVFKTKDNVQKVNIKLKEFKKKLVQKSKVKTLNKKFGVKIKNVNKNIKNGKNAYKVVKKSVDNSKRGLKLAKETAKKTYQSIKLAIKATMSAIKAIIAGVKGLVSLLIAGGWVAVVVIIFLTMIGLLFGSIFGIFFSSESSGSRTMNSVVMELNTEMANKITEIQKTNTFDDYDITSNRAEWKNILAIYVAKVSNGLNETDVITLDDSKIAMLKQIYWDMNSVTYSIQSEYVDDSFTDYDGHTISTPTTKTILHIVISSKTIEEMQNSYFFNYEQRNQVKELLSDEYKDLWASVILGTSIGNANMVEIAATQLGNVGGEPYWRWYGFNSRIEWCAVFVSWVADQAGYINAGVIPKFSGVKNGIDWFKLMGIWQEHSYVPKSGDIIFFDWDGNGTGDHVGIVEMVDGNKIFTIEGNSRDECKRREYAIDSKVILGYGTPNY